MGAAAAVAAAKRRREQQEEEEMTNYTEEDVKGEWEFKIVRSNLGTFRNPAMLKKLVQEEALSGWTMLEKFDDSRVRFKRHVSARDRGSLPAGVDPYRTTYGISESMLVLSILSVVLGIPAVIFICLGIFGFGFGMVMVP